MKKRGASLKSKEKATHDLLASIQGLIQIRYPFKDANKAPNIKTKMRQILQIIYTLF